MNKKITLAFFVLTVIAAFYIALVVYPQLSAMK